MNKVSLAYESNLAMTLKPTTHLNSLDGFRAIAALLVLFTHGLSAHLWTGYNVSSIGVAIFFSLSGFLMGFLYLDKQPTFLNIKKYLISRFSRIAPAYFFTIIISYLIFNYFDYDFVYMINDSNIVRHLLFSGNVSVFWSIPPEIQFYIFFVLVWIAAFKYINAKVVMPILLLIVCLILMLSIRNDVPGTTLPSKVHFFIFGCLAGFLRKKIQISADNIFSSIQALLVLLLLAYGTYIVQIHDYRYPYEILHYSLLSALTVFVISYQTRLTDLLFSNRLLMLIGKWSFSLYLSHEAIIYFVTHFLQDLPKLLMAIITVVLALLLSWLMYTYIELPMQALIKRRFLTDDKLLQQRAVH